MIDSYRQYPGIQGMRKVARVVLAVLLGVILLLLFGFLLRPSVEAESPANVLLAPGNPVVDPPANSHTALPTTTVSVTYDEAISAATVSTRTFAVHAMQTGLLAQTYDVDGGTISLTPDQAFKPGELVQASATTGTLNLDGQEPASPTVWQFRAAAGGDGGFLTAGPVWGESGLTQSLALGDLDGDGDLDAFIAANGPNQVWLNSGTASFTDSGQRLGSADSRAVALGDLDGDGDLDAFIANLGPNRVWLNDGTGVFHDSGQELGSADSQAVALADLDGDGDLDAFVGNDDPDDVVWINDGVGVFTGGQTIRCYESADVTLGDLDGDGDLDAFVSTCCSRADRVFLNDGRGSFADGQTLPQPSDGRSVALGDLDGDGDLDAFVGDFSGANRVWQNDGHGTFIDNGQHLGNSSTEEVALGDVDGDGDLDVFVANDNGQANTIWLNDGEGILAISQSLGGSSSQGVVLGDVDGDGDHDALDGNRDQLNDVWLNVPPQVRINQIIPNSSYFGEIVEFNGSGITDAVTEMLEEYEWTVLPTTETCGTQPDPFVLGRSARLLVNSVPLGTHKVCLRARHSNSIWSDYVTKTVTILPDRGLHSDIAVGRQGISFWKDADVTIPESNPDVGDQVYIKVRVDNISLQTAPDTTTIFVYDGDVSTDTLIATDMISPIQASSAESIVIPWFVEGEAGYRVLTVDIEYTANIPHFAEHPSPPWNEPHIESTYENNRATAFIVVGPPIVGTYAISVTADIVPVDDEPELYAGHAAHLFGDAHYDWGSRLPVMGAETSIEISGGGGYLEFYNTWTRAPFGRYIYPVQVPTITGIYTATITIFDNNLIGAQVITFSVEPRPEPLPDLYVQWLSVGLSGAEVYERDWHTYTPNRVYYHSGLFGVLNEPIVISAKVVNGGDLPAGPFEVSFYDGSPYGSGTLLGTTTVSGLISKTWAPVTFHWTPTQSGIYAIQMVVDEANDVIESDEMNNYDFYYYKYQYYYNRFAHRDIIDIRARNSDLRATDLLYIEPNYSDTVTMTATVKNIGHDRIRIMCREEFTVAILDGYPGISDTVVLTETRVTGPIAPNGSRTIDNIIWDTNREGFVPGLHHICVVVDTGKEIEEELEENNVNCWNPYVYPLGDDLQPVGLSFSNRAPRPGEIITITATIENRGADDFAIADKKDVSFYWGASDPDHWIGATELQGPIAGRGGTGMTSITWTTPPTHGTAYVWVEVAGHRHRCRLNINPDPPSDLRIRSEDIRVSPQLPVRGELVRVEADIANVGVTTATDFIVLFHTDSPAEGLVQLGSPRVVSGLAPDMTTTVQANVAFAATDRYYVIKVEARPSIGQWDADFGDNEATTSVEVPLPPDLAMFKGISRQWMRPGYAYLDYILTVANTGAVTATRPFTVTDIMPAGLNLENPDDGHLGYYDNDPSAWDCSHQGLTVTCTYSGSLAPHGSTQLHIWGLSRVEITPGNILTNCATVDAPNEDNPANNTACHTIALGEIAGTVAETDPDGPPLESIDVVAYRSKDSGWDYAGMTTTNAIGRYAFTHLEVDDYRIEFWDPSNRYYHEYYDGVRGFEDASLVGIITGTTRVIDADLDPIITGTITGTIATTDGAALEGVYAIAYPVAIDEQSYGRTGWGWSDTWLGWARAHGEIGTTATDGTGAFDLPLPVGSYRLYLFDPSGEWRSQYYSGVYSLTEATVIDVAPDAVVGINGTLGVLEPPPTQVRAGQYPVMLTGDGQFGVEIPSTGKSAVTLAVTTTLEPCSSGALVAELVLVDPADSSTLAGPYPMSPSGASTEYAGLLPGSDLVDGSEVEVRWHCTGGSDGVVSTARIALYTPNGRVTDGLTGEPISDATVTLYKVPGWLPKDSPSDSRPGTCQSLDSKLPGEPWNQTAPTTLGVRAASVLGEFSLPVNPQMTTRFGYFSWELDEGCWYVVVHAEGYGRQVSPVFGVPPEVTDLDLAFYRLHLPLIQKDCQR